MDLICLACVIFLKFPWWPVWVQDFLKGTILSSVICVLLSVLAVLASFSRKTSMAASASDFWSKMLDQAHLNPLKFLLRWCIIRKSWWWRNFLKNLIFFKIFILCLHSYKNAHTLKQLVGSERKHVNLHCWVCISYEKYTKDSRPSTSNIANSIFWYF